MKDTLFSGSKVKYRIEIESPGFDMVEDNFTITVKQGTKSKTYQKTDLVDRTVIVGDEERHEYYLCIDTDPAVSPGFGIGDFIVIVRAEVPDEDFGENGIRTEIDRFRLVNVQPV